MNNNSTELLGIVEFTNEVLFCLELQDTYFEENEDMILNIIDDSFEIYSKGDVSISDLSNLIFLVLNNIYKYA